MLPVVLLVVLLVAVSSATPAPAKKRKPIIDPLYPPAHVPAVDPLYPPDAAAIKGEVDSELEAMAPPASSPIDDVAPDAWGRFVAWARAAAGELPPDAVRYVKAGGAMEPHYGLFGLAPRTLGHLGLMRNVQRRMLRLPGAANASPIPAWTGEWTPPGSLALWQADPGGQYRAWSRHVATHARVIRQRYAGALGQPTRPEGPPASLSGLLAVSLTAGLGGLDRWLTEDPSARQLATSLAFDAANGLF